MAPINRLGWLGLSIPSCTSAFRAAAQFHYSAMSRRQKLTRDRIAVAVESVRIEMICTRLLAPDRHTGATPKVNTEAVKQLRELACLLVTVWDELCQMHEAVPAKRNGEGR